MLNVVELITEERIVHGMVTYRISFEMACFTSLLMMPALAAMYPIIRMRNSSTILVKIGKKLISGPLSCKYMGKPLIRLNCP